MKGKRVLSLALAALMTLSLLVVPAAAVSFTDMTNHWAKDDVEYLATQGVVKGTSATTFAPDQKMTACEALLFCSRATGVDAIDPDVTGAVHTVEFENRISRKPGIIQNKASLIDACRILRRYVWRIDRE